MKKKFVAAVLTICIAAFISPVGAMALTPALAVSKAYEESVYYQRLTQVELTGDYRQDIVAVALSQVGYHEGDSKNDYAGGNTWGWHNYSEYSSVWYNMDAQWCAMFVSWCARQAGIPKSAVNNAAAAHADGTGGSGAYCFHIPAYKKDGYTPVPGDIVFFSSTGKGADHVGIVVRVTDKGIYTVEGNSSNAVRMKYYDFDDDYIVYYGVYAGFGDSPSGQFNVSKLQFVYNDAVHGKMPDGDEYEIDSLYAMHGREITIPANAFVRDGYTLVGYYVSRDSDGAWYCGSDGWMTENELTELSMRPTLIPNGYSWCFNGDWLSVGNMKFYCVWENGYGVRVFDSSIPQALKADSNGWVNPFTDLPESKWYYSTVRCAYDLGILADATTFGGDTAATRAQFVEMLFRSAGEPELSEDAVPFDDVSEDSVFYSAVVWAREVGLTNGTGGNCFNPDGKMKRQEMITMLYRWLGNGETGEYAENFDDAESVSDWAVDAMAWASSKGLINGVSNQNAMYLCPNEIASRAQSVALALRVRDMLHLDDAETGTEEQLKTEEPENSRQFVVDRAE